MLLESVSASFVRKGKRTNSSVQYFSACESIVNGQVGFPGNVSGNQSRIDKVLIRFNLGPVNLCVLRHPDPDTSRDVKRNIRAVGNLGYSQ